MISKHCLEYIQVTFIAVHYKDFKEHLLTCRTRLESPVFCANCFKSLASGFWLIAKYDFMVLSWWCLKLVRIRLVRCVWLDTLPGEATDES